MKIYVIGSLRNPRIPSLGNTLREAFPDTVIFDDWYAAGPEADDYWKTYEQARGHTYAEALTGYAARNVFEFDKRHILTSDAVVLALPAGKSGHMEFGFALGRGIPGFILLDPDVDRWDVMYQFATGICPDVENLTERLKAGGF